MKAKITISLRPLDRKIAGRVVEGQVRHTGRVPRNIVDPEPDHVPRTMGDFNPLTFFSAED
jgi:hypothetical protein